MSPLVIASGCFAAGLVVGGILGGVLWEICVLNKMTPPGNPGPGLWLTEVRRAALEQARREVRERAAHQ